MERVLLAVSLTFLCAGGTLRAAAPRLVPASVEVGYKLQTTAAVNLEQPSPSGGLVITLTSSDPKLVLLSATPEDAGKPSITLKVTETGLVSPEFYVQGKAKEGTATYTASAAGYQTGTARVKLAPAGMMFARFGVGMSGIRTTTGAAKSEISVFSVMLDAKLNPVAPQYIAGGSSATFQVTSSDAKVGKLLPPQVTIPAGLIKVDTEFQPQSPGTTTLGLKLPDGFDVPVQFGTMPIVVTAPGLAITDDARVGRNLQMIGGLSLGEFAPAGGLLVTIKSDDPKKMVLSTSKSEPGKESIQIKIPAGGTNAEYVIQALADSGDITYVASAPGFVSRKATISLTPSGLVMGGPQGPPDEAELINKQIAEGPHGFMSLLSLKEKDPVAVFTVQLDPVTLRGADLTVQPLRAGYSLDVELKNSDPSVGTCDTRLKIPAGHYSAVTRFTGLKAGKTIVSVVTPEGFTTAKNSTALTITVIP